jgi:hypothetical protein
MSMECGLINRFPFPVLLSNLWPLITLYKATLTSLDFTKVLCQEHLNFFQIWKSIQQIFVKMFMKKIN